MLVEICILTYYSMIFIQHYYLVSKFLAFFLFWSLLSLKTLKKHILTSVLCAHYPIAYQNIQHLTHSLLATTEILLPLEWWIKWFRVRRRFYIWRKTFWLPKLQKTKGRKRERTWYVCMNDRSFRLHILFWHAATQKPHAVEWLLNRTNRQNHWYALV